jgi:pimeloyl-ACP methyl ester carboxylesterase
MGTITTADGVDIFYKDWGSGQPLVFSHGWPLSADDWDTQLLFFLNHGYRVVAADRRGHGRSSQTGDGHDMDHFTDDLKKISVPVLVMHGEDDQIVPYADSGPLSAKLVQHGTLKSYPGFPHGMPTTQAETINADLLAFIQS